MADLYVSKEVGASDANPGTIGSPKLTLAGALAAASAGQVVAMRGGDRFPEANTVSLASLEIESYGTGQAIISGSDQIGDLVQEGSTARWSSSSVTIEPTQVFVDDERGERVATVGAVTSYRRWHWAANVLTVFAADTVTEPAVEASVRTPLNIAANSVILRNIQVERGSAQCVDAPSANNILVTVCTLRDAFLHNFRSEGPGNHDDGRIEFCVVTGAGAEGIKVNGSNGSTNHAWGWTLDGNEVAFNSRLHHNLVGGHFDQEFSAGIKMWGGNVTDGIRSAAMARNWAHDNGPHSWAAGEPDVTSRGVGLWIDEARTSSDTLINTLRFNLVHDNDTHGIYVEKTTHALAFANITFDNAISGGANLTVEGAGTSNIANSHAWFNTIYGTGSLTVIWGNRDTATMTNCTFINNVIKPANTSFSHIWLYGDGWDLADGNVINYNFYDTSDMGFVAFGALNTPLNDEYFILFDWNAATGQDANGIVGDAELLEALPRATSPLRERGFDFALQLLGYGGVPVSQRPTIGAYQVPPRLSAGATGVGV